MAPDPEDQYGTLLASIVTDIKESQNLDELRQLRRIVRRHIPLSLRTYLGAYLLKMMSQRSVKSAAPSRRPRTRPAPADPGAPAHGGQTSTEDAAPARSRGEGTGRRPPMARAGFKRLFVNAGRVQRIQADDLKELFLNKLNLEEGQLGEVTVLGKYSFVEVAESQAETAIFNLSGVTLKGRKVAVDYARKPD